MKIHELKKIGRDDREEIIALLDDFRALNEQITSLPRGRERSRLLVKNLQLREKATHIIRFVYQKYGINLFEFLD